MTASPATITTLRLVRREAAAAPALSIVSIALLIVGATALVLSVSVVTVFAVHRRRVRRRKLLAKVEGQPVDARRSHSTADAQMTPAMRLAYSTRMASGADVERGQPVSILRNSAYAPSESRPSFSSSSRQMIANVGSLPPSASAVMTQPELGNEYTQASGSRLPPRMPPLPADGPLRIEQARQQHQRTRSSAPSSRSASVKSTKKPSHARDTSKSRSTISSALLESLGELPQVPTAASVTRAPPNAPAVIRTTSSEGHQRTYSPPRIKASLSERNISNPILQMGTDGEQGSKRQRAQTPVEMDHTLMEQASWLASALDSAFNTTNDSFSSPPRRAPPAPRPSTAATSSSAGQSHVATVISPAPRQSSPKKHETPTTGGAARVTVDYYTPYQRRTLHRDSEDEPVEMIATDGADRAASIDIGGPSMESTAALFASIEPALQQNVDTSFDRSSGQPSANTTLAFSSTITPDVSRDDTNNTSFSEGEAKLADARPSRQMPTLTLPTQLMRECQDALSDTSSNPASPAFMSNGDESSPKLKSAASFGPTLTTSKSGFAASLRAKFTLNRSRSTLAMSGGGSPSSSPKLRATTPTSPPMPSPLSPRLPFISGLSPAMSNLSALEGTSNSFGPPTETWNLSTEDVDMPSFVQSSRGTTPIGGPTETQGLGLQTNEHLTSTMSAAHDAVDDIEAPLRFVKTSTRPAHTKQASVSLERMNSVSSYGSTRPQRSAATGAWSNKLGLPAMSYEVEGGAPLSPAMEELHSTATSPRFADAEFDSPNAPPMRFFGGAGPSSHGHASTGHSVGHSMGGGGMLDEQRWMLNRQVGARQRDSMASSYCETINSDLTGYSDQTGGGGVGNGDDAQMQRAKLLQSVQKRQEARQLERKTSAKRGFTSHSASLSIDVGQGPSRVQAQLQPPKDSTRLDICVGAPFMAGANGMLTPPMTPYEASVPLPSESGVETVTSVDSAVVPMHARVRPMPTQDQRQAERLSKLRPLSLAASQHGGSGGVASSAYAGARRGSNSSSTSAIQMPPPSLQRVSHRAHASRTSSAACDVSPSSSFASAHTMSSSMHSQRITNGSGATGVALKRVSRAGSNTGSSVGIVGPMGAVHGPGLSTTMSAISSVAATTALPPMLIADNGTSPPRIVLQATQRRPSLVPYNNDQLSIDGRAPSPSRLSGSSYNSHTSHTSILNRFPALHPMAGAAAGSQ